MQTNNLVKRFGIYGVVVELGGRFSCAWTKSNMERTILCADELEGKDRLKSARYRRFTRLLHQAMKALEMLVVG